MARKVNEQAEIKITELQVLKGARELLSDESKWAKGYFAFDLSGLICAAESPSACKFCLIGAVRKIANGDNGCALDCMRQLEYDSGTGNIVVWNDRKERTHPEVIALLNKTIARLESVT